MVIERLYQLLEDFDKITKLYVGKINCLNLTFIETQNMRHYLNRKRLEKLKSETKRNRLNSTGC